jgi:hypothetical protein
LSLELCAELFLHNKTSPPAAPFPSPVGWLLKTLQKCPECSLKQLLEQPFGFQIAVAFSICSFSFSLSLNAWNAVLQSRRLSIGRRKFESHFSPAFILTQLLTSCITFRVGCGVGSGVGCGDGCGVG